MDKKTVKFSIESPYYLQGAISRKTQNIWFIFHGYGQLAEEFANVFSEINSDENALIFPQGLSKFYLKGVDGKIGSNWMTSYERDMEINNYLAYLDQLFFHEIKPNLEERNLNILGFSQGGHTASRWIYRSGIRYNKLVFWGSGLAHEIDKKMVRNSFMGGGENLVVIGDEDRFIDCKHLQRMKKRYESIGFEYQVIEYHGGHDIDPYILKQLF